MEKSKKERSKKYKSKKKEKIETIIYQFKIEKDIERGI